MSNDVLFEIGIEELPARFIDQAETQLKEKTEAWLKKGRIHFSEVLTYSTPRRLAVLIKEISEQQETIEEEVRGPQLSIAKDNDDNWTKAAIGFTKGQGVTVDDIYVKDVKDTPYIFVEKRIDGKDTFELLNQFSEIIEKITFPETMRWETSAFRFSRPIRWLVALYNDRVIPFTIANVTTSNISYGHRFLGEKITINHPRSYEKLLLEQFVVVNPKKREQMILNDMKKIEEQEGFHIEINDGLLNEVRNLVEYPTPFFGTFPKQFLTLPSEVLITSMQEHQRYFPVKSNEGKLLPYFVGVRNGDDNALSNVVKGNEKVLKARLADGVFFYEEDQSNDIDFYMEKLKSVVFQEKIGTIYDKTLNIQAIAKEIMTHLDIDEQIKANTLRAAEICKFDLMTHMVNEFPELQGTMGKKYALLFKEEREVALAIKEHYYPLQANGSLPTALPGAIVSVADKLDTIVGTISVGLIPTGSQDPYSLRRQAIGIVRTLQQFDWNITLEKLIDYTIALYNITDKSIVAKINDFFKARVAYMLRNEAVEQDVINAVLHANIGHISYVMSKAKLLSEKRNDAGFREVEQALVRVMNLGKQHKYKTIDVSRLQTDSERELYEKYIEMNKQFIAYDEKHDANRALTALTSIATEINTFFDHNMVMDDDIAIKENRLALLHAITETILQFADLTQIEWNKAS